MPVKIDIISGFLGAGKTTLIKKLIEGRLHGEKLVIIENEFGAVGIDGRILKESSIEVKEINAGCICCSLAGDFEKAIFDICLEYKPDRIIIEPSGIAKLSDVLKACNSQKLKDKITLNIVVAVVDVMKYYLYISNFSEFYENQIKNAKTIILSRTQLLSQDKLVTVTGSIRKINKDANIITTPWEELDAALLVDTTENSASMSFEEQLKKKVVLARHIHDGNCNCGCRDNRHSHNAEDGFESWVVETPRRFQEQELKRILKSLDNHKSYGMVLRGKGIVQTDKGTWTQFDYVPGEIGFKDAKADYTGRICMIGVRLDGDELSTLFSVR